MVDDRVPDRSAAAGDDVKHAGRETALVEQHPRERDRRHRRLARGLEHHRATRGDRRRELVRDEVQGKVERTDRADDADRQAQRERELARSRRARVHGDDVSGERARRDGREGERRDRALRLDARGLDRLGRLAGDDAGELLDALGGEPRRGIEDLGPLPRCERFLLPRRLGCRDRAVDFRGTALRHPTEHRAVVRRADLDPPAVGELFARQGNGPILRAHAPIVRAQPVPGQPAAFSDRAGHEAVATLRLGAGPSIDPRSARRRSFENTSIIGHAHAETLLEPLDLELLVPQHERRDDALASGARGAARNGGRSPCAPRADRSGPRRRRRRRGCRVPRHRWRRAPTWWSVPKSRSAFSRALCCRSPWIAPATTPSRLSCETSRSAPRLVRTNTIVRSTPPAIAASTLTRSISWTFKNTCVISSTVFVSETTS